MTFGARLRRTAKHKLTASNGRVSIWLREAQRWRAAPHLSTSGHQPPRGVAQEQADGRFPVLAVRRDRLGVAGPGDLGEFVLTHHNGQHGFAGRASLRAARGTARLPSSPLVVPMNIEIRYAGE
jgi:hypothetical protein